MTFDASPPYESELTIPIRHALSDALNMPENRIVITHNAERYHDPETSTNPTPDLERIFFLMRTLNRKGIESRHLGASSQNVKSLRQTLQDTCGTLAQLLPFQAIQYIELGPEPVKTRFILERLIRRGIDIHRYVAIDVNPTSQKWMVRALHKILPPEKIMFQTTLFEKLNPAHLHIPHTKKVVTMLGFEEGNESPKKWGPLLNGLLGKDDLLLTELQLLPHNNWDPIYQFYNTPEMIEFSKITLRRLFPRVVPDYAMYLLQIPLDAIGGPVMVAIMTERDNEHLYVTNFCIKYTNEQSTMIQEKIWGFKMLAQQITGDGSIAFQLSTKP